MLLIVLKRMNNCRWIVSCLLVGLLIAVMLVSSIPMYSVGILQRMLMKDLETSQLESGIYPGAYHVNSFLASVYQDKERFNAFVSFDRKINSEFIKQTGLPVQSSKLELTITNSEISKEGDNEEEDKVTTEIGSITDFEKHITVTHGKMASDAPVNGIYDVMATEMALKNLNVLLGEVYSIKVTAGTEDFVIKVRIAGTFTYKEQDDLFWNGNESAYQKRLLIANDAFVNDILSKHPDAICFADWYYALDYQKMNSRNIPQLTKSFEAQFAYAFPYKEAFKLTIPATDSLKNYQERAKQLNVTLWVINIPVILMVMFFVFMLSRLIVNHDENTIAVMKSRGASTSQIVMSYLLESGIIGLFGLCAGPPLGLWLCTFMGSANGFLEFIKRTRLSFSLSAEAYFYALAIILVLIITMLVPVLIASKTTIVQHKRSMSRSATPFWQKYFLDFILLAISLYGYFRFKQLLAARSSDINPGMDPILFLSTTFFILGSGLLFMRIYPFLIGGLYWLGRKVWTPVFYMSLLQVGRAKGQKQFLMIFLILTLATGVFNANSARTINRNNEDRIQYIGGADVVVKAVWENNQQTTGSLGGFESKNDEPLRYYEPDYKEYKSLKGIALTTKVFNEADGTLLINGKKENQVQLLGIIPEEFGQIVWFRNDLLKHHINEYLNLIMDEPDALLVSKDLKERYQLEVGDQIKFSWGGQRDLTGTVYAFVDYWPSYIPYQKEDPAAVKSLVIGNLGYFQNQLGTWPYEVWIKKLPNTPDQIIADDINRKGLSVEFIKYKGQELLRAKNDPLIQGTNAMLTLGFVASILITMIGFLIYWVISIKSRALHFGILRAMGLSLAKVVGVICCEQVLLSGVAIFVGIIAGGVAGDLYIPFLKLTYQASDQVIPFKISALQQDYMKIYFIVAALLLTGFITLWRIVARMKIVQAVKLGED